ncbi:glycosyltransferase family 4 protein [Bacillus mesophilum]|uniref:Glycosyltransferase family 4 protein n=1 Tax=Bacillus mesophilum TaxID=1071718 RepID=A0A7V7RLE6_9BACI|nr:glycosyltransferase family 4 protein [Bacillus mesophilum]KAB2332565.1 glycosyltransferase family 4 protein [Bacillus mesophilum]
MKILITTVFDYPHAGGLSTHVTTLKAGLEARGHEVDVLSISDAPGWQKKFYARGPSFVLNKVKKGKGIIWSRKARQNMLHKLIVENKSKNYDIINAQDAFATFASLESGIPTVSTVHGYMAFEAVSAGSVMEGSEEAKLLQEMEKKAYSSTRKVITVDQRIKDYVKKQAGVDGTAIRNFIDIHDFKPATDKKAELRKKHGFTDDDLVFFVPRRLTKKNGVIYPTLAFPKVLEKFPNAKLVYAGMGEAFEELKALIAEKGLENQVQLLGAVPHAKVKEFFALSDVVLVPSVHSAGVEEATSISALEAMGSGIPLIACAVGGLKEIVNHEHDGLLVEEKNVSELEDAMLFLLENPETGAQLAKNARQKIEDEYSHLAAAEKYESIYLSALEKN